MPLELLEEIRARAEAATAPGFRAGLAAGARALRMVDRDVPLLLAEIDRMRELVPSVACECGVVMDVPVTMDMGRNEEGRPVASATPDAAPLWRHYATVHMGLPAADTVLP